MKPDKVALRLPMQCGVPKRDSVTRFSRHWPWVSTSLPSVYRLPSPVESKSIINELSEHIHSLITFFWQGECLIVMLSFLSPVLFSPFGSYVNKFSNAAKLTNLPVASWKGWSCLVNNNRKQIFFWHCPFNSLWMLAERPIMAHSEKVWASATELWNGCCCCWVAHKYSRGARVESRCVEPAGGHVGWRGGRYGRRGHGAPEPYPAGGGRVTLQLSS